MSTIILQKDFYGTKKGKVKSKSPLTFRLEPALHERLEKCAKETGIKKYALALLAIGAAVDAIEANDYHLVVPIQFDVTRTAVPKAAPSSSPAARPEGSEGTVDPVTEIAKRSYPLPGTPRRK